MSKLLERLRELQGADSVTAFAKKLEMPQKTIDSYIKGERKASVELILRVCAKFCVSADWLLGRTDERTPSSTVASAATVRPTTATRSSEPSLADLQAELKSLTKRVAALEFAPSSEVRRPATAAG